MANTTTYPVEMLLRAIKDPEIEKDLRAELNYAGMNLANRYSNLAELINSFSWANSLKTRAGDEKYWSNLHKKVRYYPDDYFKFNISKIPRITVHPRATAWEIDDLKTKADMMIRKVEGITDMSDCVSLRAILREMGSPKAFKDAMLTGKPSRFMEFYNSGYLYKKELKHLYCEGYLVVYQIKK